MIEIVQATLGIRALLVAEGVDSQKVDDVVCRVVSMVEMVLPSSHSCSESSSKEPKEQQPRASMGGFTVTCKACGEKFFATSRNLNCTHCGTPYQRFTQQEALAFRKGAGSQQQPTAESSQQQIQELVQKLALGE